jgi:hypothetical protein
MMPFLISASGIANIQVSATVLWPSEGFNTNIVKG